jgi:hypothetical protein
MRNKRHELSFQVGHEALLKAKNTGLWLSTDLEVKVLSFLL